MVISPQCQNRNLSKIFKGCSIQSLIGSTSSIQSLFGLAMAMARPARPGQAWPGLEKKEKLFRELKMADAMAALAEATTEIKIEESSDDELVGVSPEDCTVAKKKKKRSKKKKAASSGDGLVDGSIPAAGGPAGSASSAIPSKPSTSIKRGTPSIPPAFRGVKGFVDSYIAVGQTHPPSIPVAKLFPSGAFPIGELQTHPGESNTTRETGEEKRYLDRLHSDLYETVREAAEVHRQVRSFAQGLIKPGIKLSDMCEALEETNRKLVGEAGACLF
jgi:hypothetical protein